MANVPMISYPDVRAKYLKDTGDRYIFDENGITEKYRMWLENIALAYFNSKTK